MFIDMPFAVQDDRTDPDPDEVITGLCFARGTWYGRYAVDGKLWKIDVASLHADFMRDAIAKSKRNPTMVVGIPKGKAEVCTDDQQLSCDLPHELGCMPVDLYNAKAFCQRNGFLLAFKDYLTEAQVHLLFQHTTAGMLDEHFAKQIRDHLGVTTVKIDNIVSKDQFYAIASCKDVALQFSPVRADGYDGHSVILARRTWFDSAHRNANNGAGISIEMCNWHLDLPYDWDWKCTNVRQIIFKSNHGFVCDCGVRVVGLKDSAAHFSSRKHRAWLRKCIETNVGSV